MDNQRVLFFDGVCALCDGFVDFLLRHDRTRNLKFAPLQGEVAQRMGLKLEENSLVYWRGGVRYERSTAAILCVSDLGRMWRLILILFVVPKFIRDFFYRWIASNRYRLFGRREVCRVPDAEERSRFL